MIDWFPELPSDKDKNTTKPYFLEGVFLNESDLAKLFADEDVRQLGKCDGKIGAYLADRPIGGLGGIALADWMMPFYPPIDDFC